jgi:hypothetical protein
MISRPSTNHCYYYVQKPDMLGLMLLLLVTRIRLLGDGLDLLDSQY